MKISLHFEKLYATERKNEPCYVAVPLKKGLLKENELTSLGVYDNNYNSVPTQLKITSRWEDNSVRWLFVRFLAKLPKNSACDYFLSNEHERREHDGNFVKREEKHCFKTGDEKYVFENKLASVELPKLISEGKEYSSELERMETLEEGEVCSVIRYYGKHKNADASIAFELTLTVYNFSDCVEMAYRIINTSDRPLKLSGISLKAALSTDKALKTCVAKSNYKTKFSMGENGEKVSLRLSANELLYEANEHFSEVFYGTFFAALAGEEGSLCGTIFQAQQNYPKAVTAENNEICLYIVPPITTEGIEAEIIMQPGMAREQRLMLECKEGMADFKAFNDNSLVYQMPDRPVLEPEVYKEAHVFDDVFIENRNPEYERALINIGDSHARCFGMLNFGDTPDFNYTSQGRGGGSLVWLNNEYDYPHACTLQYVRTGIRRFMDYMLVSARHWMDVDVCHYSTDQTLIGGQWEHTGGHCINGKIACSHQWVEGLLDYYHFTGDEEAYKTAIGIGENVLRLLKGFKNKAEGESSARETGWALRSLTALYVETHDARWLTECEWIVDNYEKWMQKYGTWLSAYTDNTYIHVPFMISIAVGSLMRYYRIRPQERIKRMVLTAVDDMLDNCMLKELGLFYYKELPSLNRSGSNPILLEALVYAYSFTNDTKYLKAGICTFNDNIKQKSDNSGKRIIGDALIYGSQSAKGFAHGFLPLVLFYKALSENENLFIQLFK